MAKYTVHRVVALVVVASLFAVQQFMLPLKTVWLAMGEYLHSSSYVLLIELMVTNGGLRGLSVKTQVCFLLVHWFRYLDSFFVTHTHQWLLILKLFYMAASALVVIAIIALRHTYDKSKDTCSTIVILISSILLGGINCMVDSTWELTTLNVLWIISHYIQGFAMLPQFIFCYRDPQNKDKLLVAYILLLGGYRVMYAFNWVERHVKEDFSYVSGPLGLGILLIFLTDYLLFKCRDRSCISKLVLAIDDRVTEMQHPLLNAFYGVEYSRLPAQRTIHIHPCPPTQVEGVEVSTISAIRPDSSASHFALSTDPAYSRVIDVCGHGDSDEEQHEGVGGLYRIDVDERDASRPMKSAPSTASTSASLVEDDFAGEEVMRRAEGGV